MYTVIAFSFVWDIIYEMKFSSLFEGIVGMSVVWSKTGCSNNSLSSQELRVLVRKKKCRVQSHKAEWLLEGGRERSQACTSLPGPELREPQVMWKAQKYQ